MTEESKTTDADAGRLELGVRPVAYVQRMGSYQGVPALGCLLSIEAEKRMKVNDPLYDQAAIDAARMAGVHSVHEHTALIVRAALELLEAVEGCEAFPPEKMAAFRRVFGA